MHAYLQYALDFAAQHVWLAVGLALLVSAVEAMLVIGLFMPSTIVLVGLGGLIGIGKLPFWPIYFATAIGAVLGDALSYWFGHHYREHLYGMWPFSRYQDLLHKGQDYFVRHGGKSVVIGRFIPGVKSVVPGIAGMMGMDAWRFTLLNVLSAFAWAATHLLPGMSAGWLMAALANVSKRLAITLGLLVLLSALLIWLVSRSIRLGQHYLPRWQQKLTAWVARDPAHKKGLPGRIILAEYAGFRQEAGMYLLLALALSGLVMVVANVLSQSGLGGLDPALSQSLQGLRTHWTDLPMLAATLSGDARVMIGVVLAVLAVLLWQRNYALLSGVALAFLVASLFIFGLKGLMQVSRPLAGLYTGVGAYSFPSGHAGFSTLIAGLLAWFALKGWQGHKRKLTVLILVLLVALIGLSRIYLGAHWPSDVLGSLCFGSLLVIVFALVFQHENVTPALTSRVVVAAALAYVLLSTWHINIDWQAGLKKYTHPTTPPVILEQAWQQGGWKQLPWYRQDIYGEQEEPFLLQWQGRLPDLQTALHGWTVAPAWSLASLNALVQGNTPVQQLPALPKLHAGHAQALTLLKPAAEGRYVLRLYPQPVNEPDGKTETIWLGSLSFEFLHRPLGQLSLLLSNDELSCTSTLQQDLPEAIPTGQVLSGAPDYSGCGGPLITFKRKSL